MPSETNKVVGLLCPNDPDGNALADPETGFPAGAAAAGYTVVDPGRFQVLSDDFSAIIGQFKEENVEVVVGIPLPPDFATFWTQAAQQDFNPKVVTMAKAILFPEAVEALGDLGNGLATEIWWTPGHPFTSSLTGSQRAGARRRSTRRPPATSGRSSSGSCTRCSRRPSTCSLAPAAPTRPRSPTAAGATTLDTIVGPVELRH